MRGGRYNVSGCATIYSLAFFDERQALLDIKAGLLSRKKEGRKHRCRLGR